MTDQVLVTWRGVRFPILVRLKQPKQAHVAKLVVQAWAANWTGKSFGAITVYTDPAFFNSSLSIDYAGSVRHWMDNK